MNKRLSALMSSMPFTELEAAKSELSRNNCHDGYINTNDDLAGQKT